MVVELDLFGIEKSIDTLLERGWNILGLKPGPVC